MTCATLHYLLVYLHTQAVLYKVTPGYYIFFVGSYTTNIGVASFRSVLSFVLREVVSQKNTVAHLESKYLTPPKILGWLRYCLTGT